MTRRFVSLCARSVAWPPFRTGTFHHIHTQPALKDDCFVDGRGLPRALATIPLAANLAPASNSKKALAPAYLPPPSP